MTSDGLKGFLDYLREMEQQLRISESNEQDANDETQDILHALELTELDYDSTATLGKKLKLVRRKRREAKDLIFQLTPLVKWIDDNKATIKSLEKVLGEVRKAEKNSNNRFYTPKTSILDDYD